ncbi:MAG TPA: hypothetical protein VK843_04030 [Planctomycetota bacterium]|nr:hypothetical protein [Planctomycetota bacterium]
MPSSLSTPKPSFRTWTLLFAALLFCCAGACSKPRGLVIQNPQNAERDYDVDLGTMPYGDRREHVVKMQNDEGRALSISNVQAGCSCTSVKLSYVDASGERVDAPLLWGNAPFVVPKGAILEVALLVDSKAVPVKNSAKRVSVRIQSDSEVEPFKTLEVHTLVEAPFMVIPQNINLGQVAIGAIAQGKAEISRWGNTGELLTGVLSHPDNMDVVFESPKELGFDMWRLTVRWFPPLERGTQMRSVVLSTTGPNGKGEGRPLEIQVQAIGVENVIAEPLLFQISEQLAPGAEVGSVTLRSLVGGNRLTVTGARAEGPMAESFRAVATAIEPDSKGRSERWSVTLSAISVPQAQGSYSGFVIVSLDDPATPEVRIPYSRKAAP